MPLQGDLIDDELLRRVLDREAAQNNGVIFPLQCVIAKVTWQSIDKKTTANKQQRLMKNNKRYKK